MTGLKACFLGILVLIGCFLIEHLQMIQTAQAAPTAICGSLVTTTWTPAGSPYDVCAGGATIPGGVTLTIDPGVTVQFTAPGTLYVQGNLVAIGSPANPITFTGVTASPGSWGGDQRGWGAQRFRNLRVCDHRVWRSQRFLRGGRLRGPGRAHHFTLGDQRAAPETASMALTEAASKSAPPALPATVKMRSSSTHPQGTLS